MDQPRQLNSLQSFLMSNKIKKVGKDIMNDAKWLLKDHGFSYSPSSFLDIAGLCKQKGLIEDARNGLQAICEAV
jgi:hypothetical protein